MGGCRRRELLHELSRLRKVLQLDGRVPEDNVQLEFTLEHSCYSATQTCSSQDCDVQTSMSQRQARILNARSVVSLHMCKTKTHQCKTSPRSRRQKSAETHVACISSLTSSL